MQITLLGTGNALVTECYNTCFVLSEGDKNLLVDAGGGNGILHQLRHAGFKLQDIHEIFVTHQHIDHLLGVIWLIRIMAQLMLRDNFSGDVNIYSHDEVINLLRDITVKLLLPYQAAYLGQRIHLITINDNDTRNIVSHDITFFDIHSARTKQYGFIMTLNGEKFLTCCGDEPCHEACESYVRNSELLLHEAFCLYSQVDVFKPYEKHHSTVRDAAMLAERLGVKNLLLYHTEDSNLINRKELYTSEARKYFAGKVFVPYDLEVITL